MCIIVIRSYYELVFNYIAIPHCIWK